MGDSNTLLMERKVYGRTQQLHTHPDMKKRQLGSVQMTTDTSVMVVKEMLDNNLNFEDIEKKGLFDDTPTVELTPKYDRRRVFIYTFIKFSFTLIKFIRESVILPFRYLKNCQDGNIILPPGLLNLLKEDDF